MGRRVKKSGCRHISTSGLASNGPGTFLFSLFWSILSYFDPNGLPVARDSWETGRGGQVRTRDTTSGSHAVASSRIPRLRSRRVSGSTRTGVRNSSHSRARLMLSREGCFEANRTGITITSKMRISSLKTSDWRFGRPHHHYVTR